MLPRQRHYQNCSVGDEYVFITTTCLDFAPLFTRDVTKSTVSDLIKESSLLLNVQVHAYVVMHNHLHLLVKLPENYTVIKYMNSFKQRVARRTIPLLESSEINALAHQAGLGNRNFWKRSFRSVILEGEGMFDQKVAYIHNNPVRAGLVREDYEYNWSSAKRWRDGQWSMETGLLW